MANAENKFQDILSDFDTAMLVSRTREGDLRARPMYIARADRDGDLWFITGLDSGKVDELSNDPHMAALMQEKDRYLSISGQCEITRDPHLAEELWKEEWRAWFPEGPGDPDLAFIHLMAVEAEYWDQTGSRGLKYAFSAAKAYLKGERPEIDEPEQHARITF